MGKKAGRGAMVFLYGRGQGSYSAVPELREYNALMDKGEAI